MGNVWSYVPELKFDFLGEHFQNASQREISVGIQCVAIQVQRLCEDFRVLQEAYVLKNNKAERLERKLGCKNHDIKKLDQEVWELRVKMLELNDQMEKINSDTKFIEERRKSIRFLLEEKEASKENTMGMIKTKNLAHGKGSQVKSTWAKNGVSSPSPLPVLSELPELNCSSLDNTVSFHDMSLALNTSF